MKYVGIDVGLSGGIAEIDEHMNCVLWDMPVYLVKQGSSKKELDEHELIRIFNNIKIINREDDEKIFIGVEKQQAFTGQGVTSMFKLGYQYGFIVGTLRMLGLPFEIIAPKTWQKELGIVGENTKSAAYAKASALFPNATLKTERGKIKDGLADALCIAEFTRRKM